MWSITHIAGPQARSTLERGRMQNSENRDTRRPNGRRDWRRIHHSPAFWGGVVLCLAAIAIYVWSDDLSWRPR
jgi:uncharacterized iron-regulated membrane protein